MLDQDQLAEIVGCDVYDSEGSKIGTVGQVYADDETGQPEWVTVNTGLFGMNESFVPIANATFTGDRLTVPYDKETIKDAPNVSEDGHLSPEEEDQLYRHYGISYGTSGDLAGSGFATSAAAGTQAGTAGLSGVPAGDTYSAGADYDRPADTGRVGTEDAMTLSEEQVNVGTRTSEAGRVRLRKYVVTENVTQTVPVRKERAVLEREPITEANVDAATSGPVISEAEHELILHEEVPVVEKVVQPVERVRLGTEAVTDERTVSEEVRKEQVDVDGDVDRR